MYIRRVKIRNVRGFKEVDLDFSRPDGSLVGWTVLAGRNGSGKSTLLKTLGLVPAGPEAARVLNTSFSDWIQGEEQQAEAGVQLEFSDSDKLNHLELLTGWARLQWSRGTVEREPRMSGKLPGPSKGSLRSQPEMVDVLFINSSPKNDTAVEELAFELEIHGVKAWIDTRDLQPGRRWEAVVSEVLEQASTMAVVIGEDGADVYSSPLYETILKKFASFGRPVIPIFLLSAKYSHLPLVLSDFEGVDLRNDKDPIRRLVFGITGRDPALLVENTLEALESPSGWFLCGYGPYRRLTGHALDAERLMAGPETISRLVSLFREDSSLTECVEWLRDIYLRKLERRPGAAELEQVVLDLLKDGLLPDGVKVNHVDSDGLWVLQHGVRIPLRELSDGYRTTAALVMDIVRHLHHGFGDLKVERVEGTEDVSLRILHEGVILIDEIDLHLHVSWQKKIGFWLKRHFPNIQFIVTTHSPFICQAADSRGLIRLPAPGEDRVAEHVSEDLYNTVVNGSLDDAILTDLFGLETPYSPEAERLRERVASLEAKLQSGKASDKDKIELRELRSRLPQTLSTDVEQALSKLAIEG